jgi:hypothetical protein
MFSVRSAVIVVAALVFGLLAGGLTYIDSHSAVKGILYGAGVLGGAILLLDNVIDRKLDE